MLKCCCNIFEAASPIPQTGNGADIHFPNGWDFKVRFSGISCIIYSEIRFGKFEKYFTKSAKIEVLEINK